MIMSNKVWFVTGASKGLGLTLAKKLLTAGYKVAATSRTVAALNDAVGTHENFLPLEVSLTDEKSVEKAIADTLQKFGQIDVVVNNAGYGQFGTLEEVTDNESRQNFDINVFGSLNVIRAVMPHLRAQRSGRIFNIASIGGFVGNFAGWGIYCATKFAVAGFTESLAAEAKGLNIYATVVYPGYFRTEFLTSGSMAVASTGIEDYADARASLALHQNELNGNQSGDPEKAADVLINAAKMDDQPVHLILGADAYGLADTKIKTLQADMEKMRAVATATQY
jgi:NAD(P)-dependent dehydrogenase (short-subunit alcohol dehydrogenase family)